MREEVKAGEALHVRAERLSSLEGTEGSSHASVHFEFHFSPRLDDSASWGRALISQWTTKRNRMQIPPAYHVHRSRVL